MIDVGAHAAHGRMANEIIIIERIIRDRESYENNPLFVVRENEVCWFIYSRFVEQCSVACSLQNTQKNRDHKTCSM